MMTSGLRNPGFLPCKPTFLDSCIFAIRCLGMWNFLFWVAMLSSQKCKASTSSGTKTFPEVIHVFEKCPGTRDWHFSHYASNPAFPTWSHIANCLNVLLTKHKNVMPKETDCQDLSTNQEPNVCSIPQQTQLCILNLEHHKRSEHISGLGIN